MNNKNNTGFTTVEIIIVVVILAILAAIPIADFVLMQKRTTLDNGAQEFIGAVRTAQNKTLAADSASQYGVYLDALVFPNKYILFKGESFASRDVAFDEPFPLPDTLEFYPINLKDSDNNDKTEIVFDRVTGVTQISGSVSIRVKADTNQNKTVYISNFGVVSFNQAPTSLDINRVKDSRHVTFDYERFIDINTDNIVLTFDGTVVQQIPISTFSTSGELDWRGTVNVGGTDQKIYIHTNHMNNPDTQFSIFRDRRYNNKTLDITISGDDFDLAQYSADGLTVSHPSASVQNFILQ